MKNERVNRRSYQPEGFQEFVQLFLTEQPVVVLVEFLEARDGRFDLLLSPKQGPSESSTISTLLHCRFIGGKSYSRRFISFNANFIIIEYRIHHF